MNDFLIFSSLDKRKILEEYYSIFLSLFVIRRGRFFQKMSQISSKRSTIAEIAAKAGVSIPTVSRVLNNRPDVATKTRERVEQVMRESGFIRSRVKNVLKESSGIIDILVPDLTNLYSVEIVRGVSEGEEVVVSGQFLIDSEASMRASLKRMDAPAQDTPASTMEMKP